MWVWKQCFLFFFSEGLTKAVWSESKVGYKENEVDALFLISSTKYNLKACYVSISYIYVCKT